MTSNAKAIIVVNVATRDDLAAEHFPIYEELYQAYRDRGLQILAFPCNQFKEGAPESNEKTKSKIVENYKTSFPIFSKIKVGGMNAHPLFTWLQAQVKTEIKANFSKYLLD